MLYTFIVKTLKLYYKLIYFAKVEGIENIPDSGAMLFCGNHSSLNDGLRVAAFADVRLKFLAKMELFKNKFIGNMFKSMGCVPVDRGNNDIKAMKICLNILKNGNPLALFPEGTRFCKHLDDVKSGALLFAIKAQVPIVPVGISNIHPFKGTKIVFGKPIYYDEYYDKKVSSDEYRKLTNELMYEIYNMVDEKCCYYDEIKASVENGN
ncbi:MAG: lysophospholipid acyltransferase family protein [Clostridia bacterium]|nr:lysophospholipid acyltransferase family protein [Clostridia bacterium]